MPRAPTFDVDLDLTDFESDFDPAGDDWAADPPTFCPYADCDSYTFTYLGDLGPLSYWRCRDCGTEFARDVR